MEYREQPDATTGKAIVKLSFDYYFLMTALLASIFGWLATDFILLSLVPMLPDIILLMASFAFAYMANDMLNRSIGH